VGRLAGIPYDIPVEVDVGWGDVGTKVPYALRWGRYFEP